MKRTGDRKTDAGGAGVTIIFFMSAQRPFCIVAAEPMNAASVGGYRARL